MRCWTKQSMDRNRTKRLIKFTRISCYRHDRFLAVRFTNRRHWCSAGGAHAVEVLAQQGIHFACRRYKYINHKVRTGGCEIK